MYLNPEPRSALMRSVMLLGLGAWAALVAPCRGLTLYDFGNPTAEEQLYLELINRARMDPPAEGVRIAATTDLDVLSAYHYFNVDLAMLQREFSAIAAQPPLAPNACLFVSARRHSAWMLATATQSHNETNPVNTPFSRMLAAGYTYKSAAENIYATAKSTWFGHVGFEVDWGVGTGGMQYPRGHRTNIHSANYREIGVGVSNGTNGAVGPQLVTQDFGATATNPTFGTGVAYYDLNANDCYDPGEGIAGLTVNVSGSSYYCTTAIGGGWTVPVVPSADPQNKVTFTGLNVNQYVYLGDSTQHNVKADLKLTYAPPAITSPTSANANTSHTLTFSPVGGASAYKWNRWSTTEAAAETCDTKSNITSSTTGTYSVLNTAVKQSGTASFHLANPNFVSQWILLSPLYYGNASPSISFSSCLKAAMTTEHFKIQVKEEDGDWLDVYDQAGSGGAGETSFTQRCAALTAMAGKAFRIRFLLAYTSGGTYGAADNTGWFIDAITFTNVATLGNNITETLTDTSGSFTPVDNAYLMSVTPLISNRNFPPSYQLLTVAAGAPTAPAIITQPLSTVVKSGSTATFNVTVTGTSPSFQWYKGTSGVTSDPVAGANGTSFTTPDLTVITSYWVRVSNAVGTANSNTVTATIITPPAIITQPLSTTIGSGCTATFTVTTTGSSPAFQWYKGTAGVTTSPVIGATGTSFTTPALTATTKYWVRVTNTAGTANSNTVTATVTKYPIITRQPASIAIKSGTTTTLTVVASSATALTYQWYMGTSPSTLRKITNAIAASYTTPTLTGAASYWVSVKNAAGYSYSSTAYVTIAAPPVITTQPLAATINSGCIATFTVAASGTAPTFQWYEGNPGVTTTPVPGATGNSFTTPPLTITTNYWVQADNAAGTAISNSATATVKILFTTWAANLEKTNNLADGTIASQPEDDFDHDGRSNLIEYAFGSSPVIGNDPEPNIPVANITATHFVLQYQCDTALNDLVYCAQACTALDDWHAPGETGAPEGFTDVVIDTSDNIQTHEASVPLSSGNCFLRVNITRK